ncbi:arginine--tRNA ligase [Streptomyces bambusae]|uniref:ArgS-related anticodon-binding protein NrtL n=1 Tax=Streptomyces bambusae TaxID=1550616 RepID=UPI001CFDD2F6|nr:DALR anticodon-binding domain-containing protein [Streptomyces bambusae]MCB5165142.1 arginine--tRNA ligase [Streptomyces bambusae]
MTPAELASYVVCAVRGAVEDGELRVQVPERVVVERTRPGGVGEYACNVALRLAREAGRPPREVAGVLAGRLAGAAGITGVEITGPGFLNFSLDGYGGLPAVIAAQGLRYGHSDALAGTRYRFPEGGGLRGEVVRAAVARLLESQGARPARAAEPVPGFGVPESQGAAPAAEPAPQAAEPASPVASPTVAAEPAPQAGLPASPAAAPACARPAPHTGHAGHTSHTSDTGHTSHARPLAPQAVRCPVPDAQPTFLTPLPLPLTPLPITPLPPRHEDLVHRLGAPDAYWVVLAVPPREVPACPGGGPLRQDEGNPCFLVRYAHSRARAAVREAARLGFAPGYDVPADGRAAPLLAALAEYPMVLEAAAHHRAPERLARHLHVVADLLLGHVHDVLPRGGEKPSAAHRARLALAEAAGTVLAGGLSLLGIDAPDTL